MKKCEICELSKWHVFPEWNHGRSVTTAGKIVDESLGKAQCKECGLIQRISHDFLGNSSFYEDSYQTYYERLTPGVSESNRYSAIVQWICDSITGNNPRSIVDIGCGRGDAIEEMMSRYPSSKIIGIEPSIGNSEIARKIGLNIVTGMLNDVEMESGVNDLVYSINVFQHTTSPREFLEDAKMLLNEKGKLVIVCPDATVPGNEMMWCDQNFSFSPTHLFSLARDAGLEVVSWQKAEQDILADKQIIVLALIDEVQESASFGRQVSLDIPQSINLHTNYIHAWSQLDYHLLAKIQGKKNVYNFGASMWSYLLRAYCPRYWSMVKACIVDECEGQFMDRKVIPVNMSTFGKDDIVVIGANPKSHSSLKKKFEENGVDVVIWDALIQG